MAYLTLVGGPSAMGRKAGAPEFDAPILRFGGVEYVRQPESRRGDLVYAVVVPCVHEWSSWYLISHRSRGSEFRRLCVKCPEQETMPAILDRATPEDLGEFDLPECEPTKVWDADMEWVVETLPAGMLSPVRMRA